MLRTLSVRSRADSRICLVLEPERGHMRALDGPLAVPSFQVLNFFYGYRLLLTFTSSLREVLPFFVLLLLLVSDPLHVGRENPR